jgi:hypothetical protein
MEISPASFIGCLVAFLGIAGIEGFARAGVSFWFSGQGSDFEI